MAAALVEVVLAVGPRQGRLRGANAWEDWGFALRDRTHHLYESLLYKLVYDKVEARDQGENSRPG